MDVSKVAKAIGDRAIENLKTDGQELSTALEARARKAATGLALTQLEALAGRDVSESKRVSQARFDNLAAAGAQGVANAIVGSVRAAIVEGLELLVTTAATG